MDRIENMKLDTDEDGFHLIFEGDLVESCQEYGSNPNLYDSLELRVDIYALMHLYEQLLGSEGFQEHWQDFVMRGRRGGR